MKEGKINLFWVWLSVGGVGIKKAEMRVNMVDVYGIDICK
jgi:hypothetical protein